jgi:CubicO group peptidase (beta-lactamase class C family)
MLASLLPLMLSCVAPGPTRLEPASTTVVNGAAGAQIDEFLRRMSGFGYSGNVLVVRRDTVLLRAGYGWANREARVRNGPGTIFDIGSLAKQFTAAAVLKLEASGRLRVTDTLGGLLPRVPADKQRITVHQLLSHSGGILTDFEVPDPMNPYLDIDRETAVSRLLASPLLFPPGERVRYSNGGYVLLAAIVEEVSGRPFQEFLRDSLLLPAGLTHTGFWGERRLPHARVALGYDESGRALHDPMKRSDSTWFDLGGGQMLSTLTDLECWHHALREGRILPTEAVARLWSAQAKNITRTADYGYGWFVSTTPSGGRLIQHGGDYIGTGVQMSWYPDDSVLFIASTNVRHDFYPTRNRTDRGVMRILAGESFPMPPAWSDDSALLAASVGEYQLPTGGQLVVRRRAGSVFLGARGQDATDLLLPASDSLTRIRHARTATAQAIFDGLLVNDLRALATAAGGSEDSEFVLAVKAELQGLRAARVLGTFSTGFPRGSDFESSFVQLTFATSDTVHAVRWANERIASIDGPPLSAAAEVPIQADGIGGLVAWHIVPAVGITIAPQRNGGLVTGLALRTAGGGQVVALRLR